MNKFYKKVEQESWYQKPEMMGHRCDRQYIEFAESKLVKLDFLKNKNSELYKLAKYMLYFDATDWHVINQNINKKYVANAIKVLKLINKKDYLHFPILNIWKSRIDHAIEVMEYDNAYDKIKTEYINGYIQYGMSLEDATNRFETYSENIKKWKEAII